MDALYGIQSFLNMYLQLSTPLKRKLWVYEGIPVLVIVQAGLLGLLFAIRHQPGRFPECLIGFCSLQKPASEMV